MILSVLDQTPIAAGTTPAAALANSIDLARHCEALGYHRYWLAEHHASPALAGSAPEILIAAVAAATHRMRIGSGGVMLPHYSPLKVAETFSLLAGLHPGRIDLGLGRAPGSDQRTAVALQRDRRQQAPHDFPNQLAELIGYLENSLPADHPFAAYAATLPGLPHAPEPWVLGSSSDSAAFAGDLGLPYCFADFIYARQGDIAAAYRQQFVARHAGDVPHVAIALWTVVADTDAEAQRLAAPARMMFAHLLTGRSIAVPDVETALAWLADRPELDRARAGRRVVAGSPETVRAGIRTAAAEYGADEVLLVNILHDHDARKRSYALAMQAMTGLAVAA
ncbi:LLM class flavin-dependent oxidoreductase [Polymorphobacter fuscus]|uniref:LLM class flavin-dependent oxidoreductase n=1 Tax=Sandarakinorhabdus fusca TaxID=1439888 RepID=UPI0016BA9CBB|nr:LLM class flavin-dependent oxidoreductase [Polymorphobacter fuscus]NJC09224.1 luciferase family oxidoreductase group 1 [Polymorphobacter fuscus]